MTEPTLFAHPADKFIDPLVSAYHMPLSAAERAILRTIWDESARQAKLECVAICHGFDTCYPDYIADEILQSIPQNQYDMTAGSVLIHK